VFEAGADAGDAAARGRERASATDRRAVGEGRETWFSLPGEEDAAGEAAGGGDPEVVEQGRGEVDVSADGVDLAVDLSLGQGRRGRRCGRAAAGRAGVQVVMPARASSSGPREAAVVVAVDRDDGVSARPASSRSANRAGERAVEVVHAVEVVAEGAALEGAELEVFEAVGEVVVGVVEAEGDEEGEEGAGAGGELGEHAAEEGVVGEAPADHGTGAELLAEEGALEAVAGVEGGAVPEAFFEGVGGEGGVAGGRAGRGRG
jgi:hypothetical protein